MRVRAPSSALNSAEPAVAAAPAVRRDAWSAVSRAAYWLGNLGLMVLQWVVMFGLLQLSHSTLNRLTQLERGTHSLPPDILQDLVMHVGLPVMIVGLLFLYPSYALATKRWHDRGKSGWWSLIAFVPIIGALWMLIELGFLGGDDGINDYGAR